MKSRILSLGYKTVARPLLWQLNPETAHDTMTAVGSALGNAAIGRALTRAVFNFADPRLAQTVAGIPFANPVGLAAGFDKNGKLVPILPQVGFGFAEIGSITWNAYDGNPQPRLTRLKKSGAIVVNYGLASLGAEAVAKRLEAFQSPFPIGISIAPTNSPAVATQNQMIADVVKTYQRFANIGAYTTLNVSCPNTHVDQPFMQPSWLKALLTEIASIKTAKPIFLKLSPDRSAKEITELLTVADKCNVAGVIASNLTKSRANPRVVDTNVPPIGGLSGKVVKPLANQLLGTIHNHFGDRFVLIGCGGIFSTQDVLEKFRLGATLVQLATGMIFEGPQLVGKINQDLTRIIDTQGLRSLEELRKSLA